MFPNIPIYKAKETFCNQSLELNYKDLQLFHVNTRPDELQIINDPNPSLMSNQTYILINELSKQIFLWIGSEANVWSRFVGARFANSLQRTKGMTFRVISIEEEDKSVDFDNMLSHLIIEK